MRIPIKLTLKAIRDFSYFFFMTFLEDYLSYYKYIEFQKWKNNYF